MTLVGNVTLIESWFPAIFAFHLKHVEAATGLAEILVNVYPDKNGIR